VTTVSFPLTKVPAGPAANISHTMWRDTLSGSAGYFDPASAGMDLTLPSSGNNAQIATGKQRYRGFVLKVTATESVTLAAPTTTPLVYRIGIMYDPGRQADPAGPLYIYGGLKTGVAAATPVGGSFFPMWEITRGLSQTLDLASVIDMRQWVYGPIWRADGQPAPSSYPYGQELMVPMPPGTGMVKRMVRRGGAGSEWWHKESGPVWDATEDVHDLSLAGGISPFAGTPWISKSGGEFVIGGAVKRSSGNFLANTTYTVSTLTDAFRPLIAPGPTFPAASSFSGAGMAARINVSSATGVISIVCPVDTPWVSLDGARWFPKGS
jgi:hypothetical protein